MVGALSVFQFFYVPETHIMYFIRRCLFLKCHEEGLLVVGGGGVLLVQVMAGKKYWYVMYYITYQYLDRSSCKEPES